MLTVQFGQCGNQVGQTLFSSIASDLYSSSTGVSSKLNSDYVQHGFDKWFKGVSKSGKHLARAVLVDTEQKVINKLCNRNEAATTWGYSSQNIVCQAGGGSANNWGYGYSVKGHQLGSAALEAVRQEIEKMDSVEGILAILSSAGGTGSGVGSYVMEKIRDELPTKTVASAIVLPYASGEVGTQNYNTLLTLAKFVEVTDILLMFENDQIHGVCESLMKIQNANFSDLNNIIAQKLASVLQPVSGTNNVLTSIVHRITPHPQYKIAAIKTSPLVIPSLLQHSGGYKWLPIVRHLKQMLRSPALDLELIDMETRAPSISATSRTTFSYSKSVSNMLITRGSSGDDDPAVDTELTDCKLYVDWVPKVQRISRSHQSRRILGKDKFAALVTNNSLLYRPVDYVVEKAWNCYVHSAFLHQYKQYGVGEDEFLHAFAKVENVVKAYKELNGVE